jgi:glycosyl transferase family 25
LFIEFLAVRGYEAGELIQLNHLHGDIWRFDRPVRLTPHIRLAKAARNASRGSSYSISRSAAAHLLRHGLPLRGSADWPCDVTVLPTLLAMPQLTGHPSEDTQASQIESDRALARPKPKPQSRALRFFKASYWSRWWFKRRTKRIS